MKNESTFGFQDAAQVALITASEDDGLLLPVRNIRSSLQYLFRNLDGAMHHPFMEARAGLRLEYAQTELLKIEGYKNAQILIWDAFRTLETQKAIFNLYMAKLKEENPHLPVEAIYSMTLQFISNPDSVFPHGTGGAVDITLIRNGQILPMGAEFDEFSDRSASDWYLRFPPRDENEKEMERNRNALKSAMESAGFVGIDNEWWHFEWGTKTWAKKNNSEVILSRILPRPEAEGPAIARRCVPERLPVLSSGVAQIFTSASDRRQSLAHKIEGHYYARTSHPATAALSTHISDIFHANKVCLFGNGLSACITALASSIPRGGTLIYDSLIYYETLLAIKMMACENAWNLIEFDFSRFKDSSSINEAHSANAIYVDNPRNWYLDSFDLNSIGNFAKEIGATFIVDTSVQPLQPTALSAADIVVLSLSKYPSLGFSMGGAILSNKSGGILFENIKHFSARNAYMLSAESAFSINGQIISLRDRMEAVSAKAWAIHTFLESCDMVKKVRIPNKLNLDGFCGGQVSFHLINPDQGRKIEELVGTNSLGHFSLHLACTFGASFTTIEHLNSNPRKREGFLGIQSNEQNIPNDILRIGVGCESIQEIISDLEFVLRATE